MNDEAKDEIQNNIVRGILMIISMIVGGFFTYRLSTVIPKLPWYYAFPATMGLFLFGMGITLIVFFSNNIIDLLSDLEKEDKERRPWLYKSRLKTFLKATTAVGVFVLYGWLISKAVGEEGPGGPAGAIIYISMTWAVIITGCALAYATATLPLLLRRFRWRLLANRMNIKPKHANDYIRRTAKEFDTTTDRLDDIRLFLFKHEELKDLKSFDELRSSITKMIKAVQKVAKHMNKTN